LGNEKFQKIRPSQVTINSLQSYEKSVSIAAAPDLFSSNYIFFHIKMLFMRYEYSVTFSLLQVMSVFLLSLITDTLNCGELYFLKRYAAIGISWGCSRRALHEESCLCIMLKRYSLVVCVSDVLRKGTEFSYMYLGQ